MRVLLLVLLFFFARVGQAAEAAKTNPPTTTTKTNPASKPALDLVVLSEQLIANETATSTFVAWSALPTSVHWKTKFARKGADAFADGTFEGKWDGTPIDMLINPSEDRVRPTYVHIPVSIHVEGSAQEIHEISIGSPEDDNVYGLEEMDFLTTAVRVYKANGFSVERAAPEPTTEEDLVRAKFEAEFILRKPGKKPARLAIFRSCGSGGCGQSLTLKPPPQL